MSSVDLKLFKALSLEAINCLNNLPDEILPTAKTVVQRKMEILREQCYKGRSDIVRGRIEVFALIKNIYTVTNAKKAWFPLVFHTVYKKGLELLLDTKQAPCRVIDNLSLAHARFWTLRERIDAFPQIFRAIVRSRVEAALETVEDGRYEQAIEAALSALEAKKEPLEQAQVRYNDFYCNVADCSRLVEATLESYGTSKEFSCIARAYELQKFAETKKACKDAFGAGEQYAVEAQGKKTSTIPEYIQRYNKLLFDTVIRPSVHYAFCRMLAKKSLPQNMIDAHYAAFISGWQNPSDSTIKWAKSTLDPLGKEQELSKNYYDGNEEIRLYDVTKISDSDGHVEATMLQTIACSASLRQSGQDYAFVGTVALQDQTTCPLFAVMNAFDGHIIAARLRWLLAETVQTVLHTAIEEKTDDAALPDLLKRGMCNLNGILKSMITGRTNARAHAACCFIYKNILFTVRIGNSVVITSSGTINAKKSAKTFGGESPGDLAQVDAVPLTPAESGRPLKLFLASEEASAILSPQALVNYLNQGYGARSILSRCDRFKERGDLVVIVAGLPYTEA